MALRSSWTANLLLLAGSFVFALLAAEVTLRFARPQSFDVHPRGMYVEDETVGYVLTPGFSGTFVRDEFRHSVSISASGLRGENPRPLQTNTFRIVCLGDSFTWGLGVSDSETYPHRLERLLAERYPGVDIQVLNAGVPGYGTAEELRFLESRGAQLEPDLVIVQFLAENDFTDNRKPALGRIAIANGWLRADEPSRRQPLLRALDSMKRHSHLVSFVSERAGYLAMRAGLTGASAGELFNEEDANLAADLLRRVAEAAANLGAPSLFVFATGQAPVISQVPVSTAARAVVARAAREGKADMIDLTSLLRARADRLELYYPRDGHWTAAGHAAVADILAAHVEKRYGNAIRERARQTESGS